MLVVDAERIFSVVRMPALIEALRAAFARGCDAPLRQIATVPGGDRARVLLSMPAFDADGSGVTKLVTIFPDNAGRGMPTVHATIVVFSAIGAPIALLDGTSLTRLRTAAASALASTYLSRAGSSRLVIVGTGSLAPYMALAHCSVRPIQPVEVWGRNEVRAQATTQAVKKLLDREVEVIVSTSLQRSLQDAHIASCATNSTTPVLPGDWVQPGTFVDLVGAYSHDMRESDDALVRRARIFVDTFEGAMAEAGDILDPIARGVITRDRVEAQLEDLVSGRHPGRQSPEDILLFKSVGAAIEDLAAARLVINSINLTA